MFQKYYNPLCNFAASIVNDNKVAQDVVQEVFTKIWDKKDELNIKVNEKSYLFQAVKNRSIEVLRKQKLDVSINKIDYDRIYNNSKAIDEQAQKFMLKEFLYKSIKQLPPKCQEVFILNKINGLTYQEISEEKSISVKTVENHIGKAYRKLREIMSERINELN